ncbi:MAG: ParA family protein [Bacteroidales bacterium]|nr:ParA family protein [Bacteroidales bacterium]
MGRIIACSNHKGGVGKTTSVVNIGAGLARLKKKVLLVDMDPQANLTQSFGVNDPEFTIYEALKGEHALVPINADTNLDVIASSLELSGAEMELSSEAGREYIFTELLDPLVDKYDYIMIDCPPSLGLLTINALTAADELFIPLQPHYLAIKGLTKIIEVKDKVKKRLNKKIEITGVFVTQYDRRKILHRDVVDTINTYFQDKVFNTKIRDNIALAEAPSQGTDIFRYNPNCFGAEDYMQLCKEILKRHSQSK